MLEHRVAIVRRFSKLAHPAVVQVGQHHVVTGRAEPPRHVVQLFALARRVHQIQHDWMRTALVGMGNEGIHCAIGGLNVNITINHRRFLWLYLRDAAIG